MVLVLRFAIAQKSEKSEKSGFAESEKSKKSCTARSNCPFASKIIALFGGDQGGHFGVFLSNFQAAVRLLWPEQESEKSKTALFDFSDSCTG